MATEVGVPTAQSSEDEGNDTSPNKSDVYPGSSAHNDAKESEQSSPGQQRRTSSQNSSDSDGIPLAPPVHQFFPHSPNIYDSDASDSSIVFNYPGTPPHTPHHHQKRDSRDRFPSFDSMASTGSFRVIGSASSQPSPYRPSPQQAPEPTPVQMLPYAQRRKLMQQREKTQKKQQPPKEMQQQQQHQIPPPLPMPMYPMQPTPYGMRQMPPYPMDPNQQYGIPYMMPPPGVPMDAVPTLVGPPMNMVPPPQQSGAPFARPPSSGRRTPPLPTTNKPPQPDTAKRKLQLHHSLPPSGPRGHTSSADTLEVPPPRPQRPRDVALPPPPPPPMSQYHIRADSSGSISSIGSNGSRGPDGMMTLTDRLGNDIAGYLQEETPVVAMNQQQLPQQTDGFFGFLNMSPRSQSKTGMTVEEFHRQNQQFLQSSEQERVRIQKAMRDSSPQRPQMPPSPQSHRPGLSSIDDDNWEEESPNAPPPSHLGRTVKLAQVYEPQQQQYSFDPYHVHYAHEHAARAPDRWSRNLAESSSDVSTSFDETDDEASSRGEAVTERTSLLPPSGISTGERREVRDSYTNEPRSRDGRTRKSRGSRRPLRRETERWDNTTIGRARGNEGFHDQYDFPNANETERWHNTAHGRNRDKVRKKSRRHRHRQDFEEDPDFYRSSSSSSFQHSQRRQMRILEKERSRLIAQWKAEALAEAEQARKQYEANRWDRELGECLERSFSPIRSSWMNTWIKVETIISNIPLTIGAIALAIVMLGVVWFKFTEENLESCQPVHFHSSQCTFPEFPGCFYCDKTARMYKIAVDFHFACSSVAGVLVAIFLSKVFLATRVVLDEMSSPTTASPAGLICMTIVCVFAGRGFIGQVLVSAAAALHLCLAIWFIYMALAYHIMPEPSWFPNTVGIGLTAVKTWLYYPMPGHLLMAISLSLSFFFFPISLVRVFLNKKMSAPATWIQMSAPAVSLYALTIMAQPSFIEEHPDVTHFQKVHRMVYLPCMHALFALAIVGMISSIQSFVIRWSTFKKKAFSPAHAAFCFPTLAHANAVQAYRAAVNSFSDMPARCFFKIALYSYWVAVLVAGTLVTIYISCKFMYHLPGWTQIDVADEEEPPAPNETALTLQHMVTTGESIQQPFVSPAVLQANETGALVMLPSRGADGRRRYRRTRRLTALGFEPIMNIIEMDHELEVLLEYVAKHPPRRRTQTLSVPGIDFNYGFGDFGAGNTGVYDDRGHSRSSTENLGRTRASTMGDNPRQPWGYYGA